MTHESFRARTGRRGAAMVEFALVLPVLMIVLMTTVFFGHSMLRKGQVISADRNFAWHQAKRLPEPQNAAGNLDYPAISNLYFNREPVTLNLAGGTDAPHDGQDGLKDAARSASREAGNYAADVIDNDCTPDVSFQTDVRYPPDTVAMDRFSKEMADRHYREGMPWHWKDVVVWDKLRDHYIDDFDNCMRAAGDTGLVHVVRNLYLQRW